MNKFFALVVIVAVTISSSFAASPKELKKALSEKYQITKRSLLTGKVKKPKTVLYVNIEGLTLEPPKGSMAVSVIRDGEIQFPITLTDGRVSAPVGTPMHIYKIFVEKEHVMMLLGAEFTLARELMGAEVEQHFQTILQFPFEQGTGNISVDDVFAAIRSVALTDAEAAEHPELLIAADTVREDNKTALEGREQARGKREGDRKVAMAEALSNPSGQSTGNTQARRSTTTSSASGNKEQAKARTKELQALADEKFDAKWDTQLSSPEPWENAADLFKHEPARTMAVLAQGHKIALAIDEISFLKGKMIAVGLQRYTNIYEGIREQVQREFGLRDDYWANWMSRTQSVGMRSRVKFVCKLDPAEAATLEVKQKYVFEAVLEDYADTEFDGPTAVLACTDVEPI